jgi:hypothetical protein
VASRVTGLKREIADLALATPVGAACVGWSRVGDAHVQLGSRRRHVRPGCVKPTAPSSIRATSEPSPSPAQLRRGFARGSSPRWDHESRLVHWIAAPDALKITMVAAIDLHLFTDFLDAAERVAADVRALSRLPKKRRDEVFAALTSAYKLVDATMLLVISPREVGRAG